MYTLFNIFAKTGSQFYLLKYYIICTEQWYGLIYKHTKEVKNIIETTYVIIYVSVGRMISITNIKINISIIS